jgi:hypothetical protein
MTLVPGTYRLGFGVVNVADDTVPSGLQVDAVTLTDVPVPEPSNSLATAVLALAFSGRLTKLRRSLK